MTTAEKIKALREKLGITQAELAERSGLSEISIRKYEKNERNPKFQTLSRIALALNVSISDLLEDFPRDTFALPPGKILLGADDDGKGGILVDPIEFQRVFNGVVQKTCPNPVSALLDEFYKLSPKGQDLAIQQVKLLTRIPEYRIPENPNYPGPQGVCIDDDDQIPKK